MSNQSNISSYDLSLLRKYVSKNLNDEETYLFGAFLRKHPEYKEIIEGLTLADLEKIEQVSLLSNSKVQRQVNGGRLKLVGLAAAAITMLIVGSVWYQQGKGFDYENNPSAISEVDSANSGQELLAYDTSKVSPQFDKEDMVTDTFYYVNRDELTPELAIEFIEEKMPEDVKQVVNESKGNIVENEKLTEKDTLPQSVTMLANEPAEEKKSVSFEFVASLDYRQSVAVEDNVAGAYKVGNTKSFAGAIGGYEYDPEGMPHYGKSEDEFYQYLEKQLNADTLLTKIFKKMEAKVSFEVDNKGRVENVNVVKCNHKQLCLKLTEIFENFPDWQPADFKGKKGSVHYVIQVNYE